MSTWLTSHLGSVSTPELQEIRRHVRAPGAYIDYTRYASAFARAYHLVNFHKSLVALDDLAPPHASEVLDLGAGSGAATAAALVYLATGSPTSRPIQVRLVDRCSRQLDLATGLLECLRPLLPVEFKVEVNHSDASHQLPIGSSPRLVFAAHVLTENPSRASAIMHAAESAAGPGGTVIALERADDPIWSKISTYCERSLATRATSHGSVMCVDPAGMNRAWDVRWLGLEPPARAYLQAAACRYFDTWLHRERGRLSAVFTSDARYRDKPFQDPILGLTSIEQYWQQKVLPQKDLVLTFDQVAYGPQSVHVEWRAHFVRDSSRWVVQGTMVLDVEPSSGLIRELREYYHSAHTEEARDPDRASGSSDR